MSTAELQRYIDERTPEERPWMAEYLAWLNRPRNVRDATPEEIERLMPLVEDLEARRNCRVLTAENLRVRLSDEPARVAEEPSA